MLTSRGVRWLAATLAGGLLAGMAGCAVAPPAVLTPPPAAAPSVAAPAPTASPTGPTASLAEVAASLSKALSAVPHKGIKLTGLVVRDQLGATLADRGDAALVPASTLKVLTSLTAVDALGSDATFATRVVSPGVGRLVLVGGGDPMLTDKQSKSAAKPASLASLATLTAAALKSAGTKSVRLGYDSSLFTGSSWNPSWKRSWQSYVARVSALSINGGRANAWTAHANPAKTAAQAFAARLKRAGIKVTAVEPARADATAVPLAEVESAPLAKIVGYALLNSDNFVAEVLARHAAIAAGQDASFTGATIAVSDWLRARGLWSQGMTIDDGSGLSNRSRIRPSTLVGAISLALATPRLAAVPAGFPVAGVNGTLKTRFSGKSEQAGRNVVHAKTGTLAGVASLAGYVTTADGATLVFAAMANQAAGRGSAYHWLDQSAAVLARCACQNAG